jgi:mono/diheme cytochrome c family protein
MRFSSVVVGLSCAALMSACSTRPGEPLHPEPDMSDAQVRRGEVVFMESCQPCHLGGGTGFGPAVVREPHLPSFAMRLQIRNGFGKMPAIPKSVLTDEDLDAVIAYIGALEHTVG